MGRLGFGSSAILASLLGILLAALACTPPEPLPASGLTYAIAFEPDTPGAPTAWRPEHREALSALPTILAVTGDVWVFTPDPTTAFVVLRTFDAGPACEDGGGFYALGARELFADYACANGSMERLRSIVLHETLHRWEWEITGEVHHICRRPDESDDCWTGGYGESVLNPSLDREFDPEGEPVGPTSASINALTYAFLQDARLRQRTR